MKEWSPEQRIQVLRLLLQFIQPQLYRSTDIVPQSLRDTLRILFPNGIAN